MTKKLSFNHNTLTKSFRTPQSIATSPSMNLYQGDIVISLDHRQNLNIIKHRYQPKLYNIDVNKSVDVMMDMLCRMIFRGRLDMFQEDLKIELCEVINNVLKKKGGNSNENTIQRESGRDGIDSGST